MLLWLIETDVFQMPQLHKHFNVGRNSMNIHQTLKVYNNQKENLHRTKGWGKPVVLIQYRKQFKAFNDNEVETLETYLRDEKTKWFVADLLNVLDTFSDRLLDPMILAAVKEPDASFNNEFIRPCRRVFGYVKVHGILMNIFKEGNEEIKIGVLKALYWTRPTVYSFESHFDGVIEIKKGFDKFIWSDDLKSFQEEFVDNVEIYNKENKKQKQFYIEQILTIIDAFFETENIGLKYQIGLRLPKEAEDYPVEIRQRAKLFLQKKAKQVVPRNISELETYKSIKQPLFQKLALLAKRIFLNNRNVTLKQR